MTPLVSGCKEMVQQAWENGEDLDSPSLLEDILDPYLGQTNCISSFRLMLHITASKNGALVATTRAAFPSFRVVRLIHIKVSQFTVHTALDQERKQPTRRAVETADPIMR